MVTAKCQRGLHTFTVRLMAIKDEHKLILIADYRPSDKLNAFLLSMSKQTS